MHSVKFYMLVLAMAAGTQAAKTVYAADAGSVKAVYEVAASFGGDNLGTIQFTDGSDQDIKAGDGVTLSAGFNQRPSGGSFGIKYLLGYKFSSSQANNADIGKSVFPVDVIAYSRQGEHRIGGGLTYHINPRVDWDWLAPDMNFDNAVGVTVEYGYRIFAVSYTNIDYETRGFSFDASHISLKLTTAF